MNQLARRFFDDDNGGDQVRKDMGQDRKLRRLQMRVNEMEANQGGLFQKAGTLLSGLAAGQALLTPSNKAITDLQATASGDTKILADAVKRLQTGSQLNAVGDLGKLATWFKGGYSSAVSAGLIDFDDEEMDADQAWAYFSGGGGGGGDQMTVILLIVGGFLLLYRRADGTSVLDGILG